MLGERRVGGGAIEQFEPVAQPAERVLPADGRDLGIERGNLHRQHFHIGRLQGCQIFFEPLLRLLLAEQRLAQEIEVHPQALLAAGGEMGVQELGLGGQDHVGRLMPQMRRHQRHRHRWQPVAKGLEAAEQRPVERAEKTRNPLNIEDVGELFRGAGGCVRTKGLVGQFDERRLVGWSLEHPVEFGLLPPFGGGLQTHRFLLQLGRQFDSGIDQRGFWFVWHRALHGVFPRLEYRRAREEGGHLTKLWKEHARWTATTGARSTFPTAGCRNAAAKVGLRVETGPCFGRKQGEST